MKPLSLDQKQNRRIALAWRKGTTRGEVKKDRRNRKTGDKFCHHYERQSRVENTSHGPIQYVNHPIRNDRLKFSSIAFKHPYNKPVNEIFSRQSPFVDSTPEWMALINL